MIRKYIKSSLFRSAGIYTISSMLNSAVPFLLVFILTRHIAPQEYGIIATFLVLVNFVMPFTGLSIQGAIAREYYERENIDFPLYVTNAMFIFLGSTVLVSIIIFSFSGIISRASEFPAEWLWSIVIVSLSQFIVQVVLTLWQVQVRPVIYGIFQISQTVLIFLLTVYFVVSLDYGWQGYILAQVYIKGLYAVIGVLILVKDKWIKIGFNLGYIKDALRFGVPLVPHTLGGWLRASADRILLNNIVGLAGTGLYSVGFQITTIITLIETSFNNAWVPWFYENLKLDKFVTKLRIVKFTYLYIFAMIMLAIIFSIAVPPALGYLLGEKYSASGNFIAWLAIAKAVDSIYYMASNYLFYMKKTIYITAVTFGTSVIHIIAAYFLIINFGAIAAAQTTLFSSIVMAGLIWFFAAKKYKMPWSLNKKSDLTYDKA